MENKKFKRSGCLGDIAPFFLILGGIGILACFFNNDVLMFSISLLVIGSVLYLIDRIRHN